MKNHREKLKILCLTNMISPYRIPLFNYFYVREDFKLEVIVLIEREENREWEFDKEKIKFDYQILKGYHWLIRNKRREIVIHLNKGILRKFLGYKPNIVITSGYDSLAYWEAFLYCKIFRKRFILWNGTTLLSAGSTTGIRGLLKRIIIKGADRYIAYGTKAKEYLEYLGADVNKIHISTNTVDVIHLQNKVMEYRNGEDFIKERELYPKYLLLYVGQLIRRKGIIQVLKALDNLSDSEVGLMIVGSGPQGKELKKFCEEKNLNNIFFKGFQQQEMLPKYYALADVFILPSFEEVWGLVVNEALASGLYVLCSDQAGAAYDLIRKGWNGEIFDPNNIEELVIFVKRTKEQIEEIRKQRKTISEHACKEFSIERSAHSFTEAIEEVQCD